MKKISKIKDSFLMFIFLMTFKINNIYAAVDCNGVLGNPNDPGTLGYYVNYGLQIMRIGVPVLIIVMCSIDMFKAVISSSEDKMKKAQQTMIKRIAIGIAFVFIPTIVNFILKAAGDSDYCLFTW